MTLGATARDLPARRNQIVDQAVLVGGAVILFMGLVGRLLLGYLGITLPAFTIAGGVLLFLIAIDMLFARPTGAKRTEAEEREAAETENPAVFPLAVPMIAGPERSRPCCCWSTWRAATVSTTSSSRWLTPLRCS